MKQLVCVSLLALAACSPQSQPQAQAAPPQEHQQPVTAANAPKALTQAPTVSAPDPLAQQAIAAQQRLFADKDESDRENDAELAIENRVLLPFGNAVQQLQQSGVQFDSGEAAFNTLDVRRREQGIFPLHTQSQDPTDHVRVLSDGLTTGPFAAALLRGTYEPVTFGGSFPGNPGEYKVLKDGKIAPNCLIMVDDRNLSCQAVMDGREDAALLNMAKHDLLDALKEPHH